MHIVALFFMTLNISEVFEIFEVWFRSDQILKFKVQISLNWIFLIFEKFGSDQISNFSNFLENLVQWYEKSYFWRGFHHQTLTNQISNSESLCNEIKNVKLCKQILAPNEACNTVQFLVLARMLQKSANHFPM